MDALLPRWLLHFGLLGAPALLGAQAVMLDDALKLFPAPSKPASRPRVGLHAGPGFVINPQQRERVRQFYHTVYKASEDVPMNWTGNVGAGQAGTTSRAFRDAVILRVNYFRAMAGVPAVIVLNDTFSAKCQQAALMMSANRALDHFPPVSWDFYTPAGAEAAGHSNLAIGNYGAAAINAYISDGGNNNAVVGHRRWIFFPPTLEMGTGDVQRDGDFLPANVTWILDSHSSDPRPATRETYVAWPPPGFVPYTITYPRWSISIPGADFSQASVSMTRDGTALELVQEAVNNGAGENTLVWVPQGFDASDAATIPYPKPDSDTLYAVQVTGIRDKGNVISRSYNVMLFDPEMPGPDTVLPVISGLEKPAVGIGNTYSFTAVPGADGYEWRRANRAAFVLAAGAEAALAEIQTETTPGYNPVVTGVAASGSRAYHLAHSSLKDQFIKVTTEFVPSAGSEIRFQSRLGWATPDQHAQVEVSKDGGRSWEAIYSQPGDGSQGESKYQLRIVSLSAYAGLNVQIRFVYAFDFGTGYTDTDPVIGWLLDDIVVTAATTLSGAVVEPVTTGTSFSLNPSNVGQLGLQVRPVLFGNYRGDWGPIRVVDAVVGSTISARIRTLRQQPGGNWHLEFESNGTNPGAFKLEQTPSLPAAWSNVANAAAAIVSPGLYRFNLTALNPSAGYFRVRAN